MARCDSLLAANAALSKRCNDAEYLVKELLAERAELERRVNAAERIAVDADVRADVSATCSRGCSSASFHTIPWSCDFITATSV
jgi:hypothetical protein